MKKKTHRSPHVLSSRARGANMVEYIILVGLVALICVAGYTTFGKNTNEAVGKQAGSVQKIGNQAP